MVTPERRAAESTPRSPKAGPAQGRRGWAFSLEQKAEQPA